MASNPYRIYNHTDPTITTVQDFIDAPNSLGLFYKNKIFQLLEYDGGTGISNSQRLKNTYLQDDFIGFNILNPKLKIGAQLLLEQGEINGDLSITDSPNINATNSFTAFMADKLKVLLQDPQYVNIHKSNKYIGTTKEYYPDISVWMWCRALSKDDNVSNVVGQGGSDLQGSFLDITPFIQSINTTVSANGGNFSFILSPLICEPDAEKGWIIKKSTIKNYFSNNVRNNYTAQSSLHTIDKEGDLKRNQFFFHNIIGANDLIFIRFETLSNESKDRSKDMDKFYVDQSMIPGKIYDMIGLVDVNSITTVPQTNEVGISIQGRDLVKVLIEDGAYIFPEGFASDIFVHNQDNDKLLKRIYGKYESFALYVERSIDFSLKFIINQLASTGLVPDSVFNGYGSVINSKGLPEDVRTKFYRLDSDKKSVSAKNLDGVWQIIKLIIDQSVQEIRIIDSSISTGLGSILNYFNKVCTKPFVEFMADTYGDQYYMTARRPPFTQDTFRQLIYGGVITEEVLKIDFTQKELVIDIDEADLISEQLRFDDSEVYSWYILRPKGIYFGNDQNISLTYLPAVYFSEYSDIWGSKPLDVTTNYVPFMPVNENGSDKALNVYERQAFRDLKYLIDTHAYLPFTRKGVITINGDRRIKRGTTVRLKSTGEIFYVDTVTNSYQIAGSIDRTTTLEVSRGMVEEYINRKDISYFNIINTPLNEEFFKIQPVQIPLSGVSVADELKINSLKNWTVNKNVFNFFLKRNQFKDNQLGLNINTNPVKVDNYNNQV